MEQPPNTSIEKYNLVKEILKHESNFYVYFNPRRDDVIIPEFLKDNLKLALEFGNNLHVPIEDFEVNENGVGGTLSFKRTPHYCWVPWSSIFCITVSGTTVGKYWESDIPTDSDIIKYAINKSNKSKKHKFKVINGGKSESDVNVKKDYSHLKVIK